MYLITSEIINVWVQRVICYIKKGLIICCPHYNLRGLMLALHQ